MHVTPKNTVIQQTARSLLAVGVALASLPAWAEDAASLEDAITGGKASLDLRYRYEFVDQDKKDEAKASTLRTRLTFETQSFQGFSSLLEVDNNTVVLEDDYNDGISGDPKKSQYAVIADPTYTEVNQAYLNYSTAFDTSLRYGRQRIIFDNQRFVGGVAWRQNEQTFDAVTLVNKSLPNTVFTYAYAFNVNRINLTDLDGHHHFFNLTNTSIAAANVSAYAYVIDNINDTYGVRLAGKIPASDSLTGVYALEYATQSENGSAPDYDADYYLIEAGAIVSGITAKLGYEVQTSDDGKFAFTTPLGTNHAFNGWADQFLATPKEGLEDRYVSLSTAALGPELTLMYHSFESDYSSIDFGDEIDFSVGQTFQKRYSVLLKYAHFNGDEGGKVDVDKIWLQLGAKF